MKEQIIREIETIEDNTLLNFLYRLIVSLKKHRAEVSEQMLSAWNR